MSLYGIDNSEVWYSFREQMEHEEGETDEMIGFFQEREVRTPCKSLLSRPSGFLSTFLPPLRKPKQKEVDIPTAHCSGTKSEKKDFAKLYKKALQSDLNSMFTLAFKYHTGADGVDVNTREAIRWYVECSSMGDHVAMNNLGVLHYSGHHGTIVPNMVEAVQCFEKAAATGETSAQFHLGLLYMSGKGVGQEDHSKAFSWFLKAAEQGCPEAMANVGAMLLQGIGVESDLEMAIAGTGSWYFDRHTQSGCDILQRSSRGKGRSDKGPQLNRYGDFDRARETSPQGSIGEVTTRWKHPYGTLRIIGKEYSFQLTGRSDCDWP